MTKEKWVKQNNITVGTNDFECNECALSAFSTNQDGEYIGSVGFGDTEREALQDYGKSNGLKFPFPSKDGWNVLPRQYPEEAAWVNEGYVIFKHEKHYYLVKKDQFLEHCDAYEKLSWDDRNSAKPGKSHYLICMPTLAGAQAASRVHFDGKQLSLQNIVEEMER